MKNKFVAAIAVGLTLCSWAGKAEAFQYVFHGTVTDTSNQQNINADYLKGQAITITFDGNGAAAIYDSAQQTDLVIALHGALAQVGSDTGYFSADYPATSLIKNNGTTSSINLVAGTSFNQFGPFQGADGGLELSASSSTAGIPLDPEQSFAALAVSGSGMLFAPSSLGANGLPTGGGYSVSFSLASIQGIGAVSSVPLPAAAPMFGAALLAVAGLGYGVRRRGEASAA